MAPSSFRLQDEQIDDVVTLSFPARTYLHDVLVSLFPMGPCVSRSVKSALACYGFTFRTTERHFVFQSPAEFATLLEIVEKGPAGYQGGLFSFEGFGQGIYPVGLGFDAGFVGPDAFDEAAKAAVDFMTLTALGLRQAKMILITFAGARYARLKDGGVPVPMPSRLHRDLIETHLPTVAECVLEIERIHEALRRIRERDAADLVLAISPERTLAGGLPAGQDPYLADALSKSVLRAAIGECRARHPDWDIGYFPADEMVTYELRQFETLCHTDHRQIDREHTPLYLTRRFLEAYAAPSVGETILLIDDLRAFHGKLTDWRAGGISPVHPRIVAEANRLWERNLALGLKVNLDLIIAWLKVIEGLEALEPNLEATERAAFAALLATLARHAQAFGLRLDDHDLHLSELAAAFNAA